MNAETPAREPAGNDAGDAALHALARAAFESSGGDAGACWPTLDLEDAEQRRFGDFELLEEIGRGGMGVVYRARQASLDREVALKFVAAGVADGEHIERLRHEARAAARLVHPNIVPVHEAGTIDGIHYFAMALVEGRPLSVVARHERPSQRTTIALMLKVCDAIEYAHRIGLLHLDLKPSNVLVDARGEPLVADFGLARRLDDGGGFTANVVSGTPGFMAPEQVLIREHRLTAATDVYAIGAILYWCVTGVSPHGEGHAEELVRRAVAGEISPPRKLVASVPRDLEAVCLKCLALNPAARYASVGPLSDDLRRLRDGMPVSVRHAGFPERVGRWMRREPAAALGLGLAVMALLGGTTAAMWQAQLAQSARVEATRQRDAAVAAEGRATAQRDRALLATEMGAFLYANSGRLGANRDLAERLIDWSRRRLPSDDVAQAEALGQFASAVSRFGPREFFRFLFSLIEAQGAEYRKRVMSAFAASTGPMRHLHVAMLTWSDQPAGVVPPGYRPAMDAALVRAPEDAMTLQVAALFNTEGADRALYPHAALELVRRDPANLYHWLLVIASPGESDRRAALRQAARRTAFDDYSRSGFADYELALATSKVEVPPRLAAPLRLLHPAYTPQESMASFQMLRVPFDLWRRVRSFCDPVNGEIHSARDRADCIEIAKVMARSDASLAARMTGVAIINLLAPDTPLAREMLKLRRNYVYLREQLWRRSAREVVLENFTLRRQLLRQFGELEALARQADRAGIARLPPTDWQPDYPEDLPPPPLATPQP